MGCRILRLELPRSRRGIGPGVARLDAYARGAIVLAALISIVGAGAFERAEASAEITVDDVLAARFSPNGDGVRDSTTVLFTPGGTVDSVEVTVTVVRASDDSTWATPLGPALFPIDVPLRQGWGPAPGTAPDGSYRLELFAVDGSAFDTASATVDVVVDTEPPVVELGYAGNPVGPSPFDPAALDPFNRLLVPIRVTGDSTTATTVQIWQDSAAVNVLGVLPGPGEHEFVWDGLASDSSNAPSGAYEVAAIAQDLAGNRDEERQTVRLDRDAPTFVTTGSDTLETTAFPVTLRGAALDDHLVATVEASFDSGGTWVPADTVSAPSDSVSWSVVVADAAPSPGRRSIRVRAIDEFGHTEVSSRIVAYDTSRPMAGATTPIDGDGTYRDGDLVRLLSAWNTSGLSLEADFSNLDSEYSRGDEEVIPLDDGDYRIEYRISPTNSRSGGTKDVEIRATATVLSGTTTISLNLVNAHENELVIVDRNRFDPDAGDEVSIVAESSSASVRVEIYNLAGHQVRTLEGQGLAAWDGRNDAGRGVASGVYLLRIQVEGAEEVRKVAVIRRGGS
jgi:flagellar hook assembly protein FlgD